VRFLSVLDALGLPRERLRLVLNQNYSGFAGNLKPGDIQQRLGRELDLVFPFTRRLLIAMNLGSPYILRSMRLWGFGREMSALVDEIETIRERQPAPSTGVKVEVRQQAAS